MSITVFSVGYHILYNDYEFGAIPTSLECITSEQMRGRVAGYGEDFMLAFFFFSIHGGTYALMSHNLYDF
jgi:hypothetical protein